MTQSPSGFPPDQHPDGGSARRLPPSQRFAASRRFGQALLAATGVWLIGAGMAWAQQPAAGAASSARAPAAVTASKPAPPSKSAATRTSASGWSSLTPDQQQALKPLQANWGSMSEAHQRKWIALSRTYPTMSPPEQARLHSRMTEWATLSPRQRADARLNFAETKQHSPDEKKAKWQAYQALSPEEKQKLAANAKGKPQGAAPAVKPVPTQKLAVVPSAPSSQKKHPTIAGASGKLDQNTLLPHPAPAQADAPTHRN